MKVCAVLSLVLIAACGKSRSQDEAPPKPASKEGAAAKNSGAKNAPDKPKPRESKMLAVEPTTVWELPSCEGLLTVEEISKTCGEVVVARPPKAPSEHYQCYLRWEVPDRHSDEGRTVSLIVFAGTTEAKAALQLASSRAEWDLVDPVFERPEEEITELLESDLQLLRNTVIWGRAGYEPSEQKAWAGSSVTSRWHGVRASLSDSVRTNDEQGALCEDDELVALGETVLKRISEVGRKRAAEE